MCSYFHFAHIDTLNVHRATDEKDVRSLLESFGDVLEIIIMKDQFSGESKGSQILPNFTCLSRATARILPQSKQLEPLVTAAIIRIRRGNSAESFSAEHSVCGGKDE